MCHLFVLYKFLLNAEVFKINDNFICAFFYLYSFLYLSRFIVFLFMFKAACKIYIQIASVKINYYTVFLCLSTFFL